MQGNLSSGKSYSFTLEIEDVSKLSLIQDNKWTDFNKKGNRFTITSIKLNPGSVQIALKNKKSNRYTTVLEYNVL